MKRKMLSLYVTVIVSPTATCSVPSSMSAAAAVGTPNWGAGTGHRIDSLGLDSAYDYDPVWQKCMELRVAPASHTPGMGWGSRRSISSYVYNHIGSFAASMDNIVEGLNRIEAFLK